MYNTQSPEASRTQPVQLAMARGEANMLFAALDEAQESRLLADLAQTNVASQVHVQCVADPGDFFAKAHVDPLRPGEGRGRSLQARTHIDEPPAILGDRVRGYLIAYTDQGLDALYVLAAQCERAIQAARARSVGQHTLAATTQASNTQWPQRPQRPAFRPLSVLDPRLRSRAIPVRQRVAVG